jgi:hypothetical protein
MECPISAGWRDGRAGQGSLTERPDRTLAFDEFGPLGIRPTGGACWAKEGRPDRLPATYHRAHGVTCFHGCYSIGDDALRGINRRRKGIAPTWDALKTIRSPRPDGAPIYVILDNPCAHKNERVLRWAAQNKVELCFTPTNASWADPIEAHFGHCDSSPSPTPITPTTPSRHATCTGTCAGATRMPGSPPSWPHNRANAPASPVRRASAGADVSSLPQRASRRLTPS